MSVDKGLTSILKESHPARGGIFSLKQAVSYPYTFTTMIHIKKKNVGEIDRTKLEEPVLTETEWQQFLKGVELFNARKFWEAHEVWEEVWKQRGEESRIFFQGIIQAAAAYHLILVKRRFVGARNNMDKAVTKLELFKGKFLEINVEELKTILAEGKKRLEALGAERISEFPHRLVPFLDVKRKG